MPSLIDDLTAILKGGVTSNSDVLEAYSTDASIFKIEPKIVAAPKDKQDLKKAIQFALKNDLPITPRSAGTDMSGGAIGEGLILDMTKHFNHIISIEEDSAIVEPGVFYRDFEVETLKKNLILPCFTASKDLCTVGGMVANNSAGERTLKYGQTKDFVKKLKVMLSDGNEYIVEPLSKKELESKITQKDFEGQFYSNIFNLIEENSDLVQKAKPITHKNSSGYNLWDIWDGQTFDLTKLFTGSQGTLGIITEIEFKLIPTNSFTSLLVIPLKSITQLDIIVNEVLKFEPLAFEVYDDQTISFAIRFLPELQKHFRFNNAFEVFIESLPERLKVWTHTLPKLTLLAQFDGSTEDIAVKKAKETAKSLKRLKVKTLLIDNDKQAEKYWVTRHESFNMLRHHAKHMRTAPFIDDFIIKPEYLPQFLPKLELIMSDYNLIYTIAGHIGDGNLHIIPLMDFSDLDTKTIIPELSQKVYDLVLEFKGSITAEHNDGLIRGPYLPQMFGENVYQLFKKVKEIFDPKGIFNPHKKVDATFEYAFKHMAGSETQE
jgi:FAD/FMN-containing dehydrogenase